MSEEEREVISAGLRDLTQTMRQFFRASDAAWRAQVDALPKKLRDEVYAAARAESAAANPREDCLGAPGDWLWAAMEGDRMTSPTVQDAAKANAAIIAKFAGAAALPAAAER